MNILYIFGNGFDKAQGMATSYPEFYKYLEENVKNGSPLFNKMMEEITQNVEFWADMEIALGNFTSKTNNADEFYEFYFELIEYLQNYLRLENEKFIPSQQHIKKIQTDFPAINYYLDPLDNEKFNTFFQQYNNSYKEINVLTLNYTYSLEKLLELPVGQTSRNILNYKLNDIIHLHGKLDDSTIIGVDNEMQIKNELFRINDDIKDCMIKIQSNETMKEIKHLDYKKLINRAQIIVLFGVSLGNSDAYLWKSIGEHLKAKKDAILIQHIHAPREVPSTQRQKRGKLEREKQELIKQQMQIEENIWTNEIKNRVFFPINKSIYKIQN